MGEKWPTNFTVIWRVPHQIKGSLTCRKSATWDRRLYFPSEGRHAEDFSPWKIRRLEPGLNPRVSSRHNGQQIRDAGEEDKHTPLFINLFYILNAYGGKYCRMEQQLWTDEGTQQFTNNSSPVWVRQTTKIKRASCFSRVPTWQPPVNSSSFFFNNSHAAW
jgi:hypothetical protein